MPRNGRTQLCGKRVQREQELRADALDELRRQLRREWRAQSAASPARPAVRAASSGARR
jgi:hypothetical protein